MTTIQFEKDASTNTMCEVPDTMECYKCQSGITLWFGDCIVIDTDIQTFSPKGISSPNWIDLTKKSEANVKQKQKIIMTINPKSDNDMIYDCNRNDYYYHTSNFIGLQERQPIQVEQEIEKIVGIDTRKITERAPEIIYYYYDEQHQKYFVEAKSVIPFFEWLSTSKNSISTPHLKKTFNELVEHKYLTEHDSSKYLSTIKQFVSEEDERKEILKSENPTNVINFINQKIGDPKNRTGHIYYVCELLNKGDQLIQKTKKDSIFNYINETVLKVFKNTCIHYDILDYDNDNICSNIIIDKLIEIGFTKLSLTECGIWHYFSHEKQQKIERIIRNNKSLRQIVIAQQCCDNSDHSLYTDSIKGFHLESFGSAIADAPWLTLVELNNCGFTSTQFKEFLQNLHPTTELTLKVVIRDHDNSNYQTDPLNKNAMISNEHDPKVKIEVIQK